MRLAVMFYFNKFIDAIVRQILDIEDYLGLPKDVRASEIGLFLLAAGWFFWLLCFNVQSASPVFDYMFSELAWTCIFGAFAALHFFGVWIPAFQVRQLAVTGYAVIWFVWVFIVAYGQLQSPFTPTIFVIELISIYVAVRISRHNGDE